MTHRYNQGVADANRRRTKHGGAAENAPPLLKKAHRAYHEMKSRCTNPNETHYHRYGGRGVSVTPAWDTFEQFLQDVGLPPSTKHTLDRIDNDGNYTPENTRWATRKEQANNRSTCRLITHNGKTMNWTQWAEETGVPYYQIKARWLAGKRGADIFAPSVRAPYNQKVNFKGESKTLREWAEESGIPYVTIYWRHKNGREIL